MSDLNALSPAEAAEGAVRSLRARAAARKTDSFSRLVDDARSPHAPAARAGARRRGTAASEGPQIAGDAPFPATAATAAVTAAASDGPGRPGAMAVAAAAREDGEADPAPPGQNPATADADGNGLSSEQDGDPVLEIFAEQRREPAEDFGRPRAEPIARKADAQRHEPGHAERADGLHPRVSVKLPQRPEAGAALAAAAGIHPLHRHPGGLRPAQGSPAGAGQLPTAAPARESPLTAPSRAKGNINGQSAGQLAEEVQQTAPKRLQDASARPAPGRAGEPRPAPQTSADRGITSTGESSGINGIDIGLRPESRLLVRVAVASDALASRLALESGRLRDALAAVGSKLDALRVDVEPAGGAQASEAHRLETAVLLESSSSIGALATGGDLSDAASAQAPERNRADGGGNLWGDRRDRQEEVGDGTLSDSDGSDSDGSDSGGSDSDWSDSDGRSAPSSSPQDSRDPRGHAAAGHPPWHREQGPERGDARFATAPSGRSSGGTTVDGSSPNAGKPDQPGILPRTNHVDRLA
jgi:hypothetical protein